MVQDVQIEGMHCSACQRAVKIALEELEDVSNVTVSLEHHMARLETSKVVSDETLHTLLASAGAYSLKREEGEAISIIEERNSWQVYKPLWLLGTYALLLTILSLDFSNGSWLMLAMRTFMGALLIGFSFLKLLDLKGFAKAFATYDVVGQRSKLYSYAYPFIELALGLAYLYSDALLVVNLITAIIMLLGAWGVFLALKRGTEIQCACVGTSFNLPMSRVTLIEDLGMAFMALLMILL